MKKDKDSSARVKDSDELYFTISDAAQQVGVVQATIRNWEKKGLVKPKRTSGGYRVFSHADIGLLKSIRQKSKEENIGTQALQSIYGEDSKDGWHSSPKRMEAGSPVAKKEVASRIKACRLERGYQIKEVAAAVGMSISYLSRIENGQANASFKMLQKLSDYYGVDFLGDACPQNGRRAELVRRDEGNTLSVSNNGISIEAVSGSNSLMSVMIYTVKPNCGRKKTTSHKGEEFVHVIKGRLSFKVAGEEYILKAGDSLSFKSEEPHTWYNSGSTTATIFWTYCPITL